jgi:nucleoside-diphosphate-sugar epimerase
VCSVPITYPDDNFPVRQGLLGGIKGSLRALYSPYPFLLSSNMVQVLVLGATGSFGSSIAFALRRAGHVVHALVRDPSKAKARDLELHEIITFKGDAKDGSTWKDVAVKMDVVIDAAETMLGPEIFKIVLEAAKSRPKGVPKLTFIYTSGIW